MKKNMRTIAEVSQLTGISARALHHYDAIGLLKPTDVTAAGYRLYDDTALGRLRNILMFREVGFPLKEIKAILDNPDFDPAEALEQQIQLLELQRERIGKLISFAREIQKKGVENMNLGAFSKSELENYGTEVKERWGATELYQEYERKNKGKRKDELKDEENQLMDIFAELGELRRLSPDDTAAQEKIGTLRQFITEHYYICTNETLKCLGQMYTHDERMKRNIDQAGGVGTADFASQAILAYCAE